MEEQSEKAESRRENLWMKYSWNDHKDSNRHKGRIKRSGQGGLLYVKDRNRNIPTTWRWACWDSLFAWKQPSVDLINTLTFFFFNHQRQSLLEAAQNDRIHLTQGEEDTDESLQWLAVLLRASLDLWQMTLTGPKSIFLPFVSPPHTTRLCAPSFKMSRL